MTKEAATQVVIGQYYHIDDQSWKAEGQVLGKPKLWYLSKMFSNGQYKRRVTIERTEKQILEGEADHHTIHGSIDLMNSGAGERIRRGVMSPRRH